MEQVVAPSLTEQVFKHIRSFSESSPSCRVHPVVYWIVDDDGSFGSALIAKAGHNAVKRTVQQIPIAVVITLAELHIVGFTI